MWSPTVTKGAYIAGVVYRGNGERIGVGTGRACFVEADAVVVQALMDSVLCPVAGVTGRHGDHGVAVHQVFHDSSIDLVVRTAGTGVAGAQGQVHRVTAQDNGVLNGGHVVGNIRAAGFAENLHGDDLCIGSHTLHLDLLIGVEEGAVFLGDVGVGSGDAFHVRAVLAHGVVVVGDIQALVNVVKNQNRFLY